MKKSNYPIIVRRHKESQSIELFMLNTKLPNGLSLECYSNTDGHSQASMGYYLECTEPVPFQEAQFHFNRYTKDWEGESTPVLRQRFYLKGAL